MAAQTKELLLLKIVTTVFLIFSIHKCGCYVARFMDTSCRYIQHFQRSTFSQAAQAQDQRPSTFTDPWRVQILAAGMAHLSLFGVVSDTVLILNPCEELDLKT